METVSGWNVLAKLRENPWSWSRTGLPSIWTYQMVSSSHISGSTVIYIYLYIYTHKYVGVCLCVCISVTWVFGIIHNKAGDSFTYYPLLTIVSVTSQRGVIIINLSGLSNPRVSFRDHLKVSRGQYSKMLDFQFQLSDERQHLDRSPWISI